MTIIVSTLIILYCLVGFIFHIGIGKEYRADTSNTLDEFSPGFIELMIVSVAILWPLMVAYHLYLQIKNKTKDK